MRSGQVWKRRVWTKSCAMPMSAWAWLPVRTHVPEDLDMAHITNRYRYQLRA